MPDVSPPSLPPGVLAFAERGPQWTAFVHALPRLVRELCVEWELTPDGGAAEGSTALVSMVRTRDGEPAALKVGFPHEESEHEALALQRWGGRSAVRLLRADPHRSALLLERLHPADLRDVWDVEACELVGSLYADLHIAAPPQLRTLTSYVASWNAELAALPRSAPLPRRLVEQAVSLGRDLAVDEASTGTLVHTDLHYENVLAAERADWLVIDPKPLSGDPHYEVAPLLWNRWEEVTASGDVRRAVRARFHAVVDAAGLDEARARDWVVVRMLNFAMWELREPADSRDGDTLTACVAIAKAVQD